MLMLRQVGAYGTVAFMLSMPLPAVAQQDAQAEDENPPQFTDEITVRVPGVKGGPKLDQSGGGKLDHPAARWRV